MHFKARNLFFIAILFLICVGFQSNPPAKKEKVFPKPENIENMLFYVQRTMNINTLIYELNLDGNKELNADEPIKIHWVNYASDKSIDQLNYVQRKYAYGIEIKLLDAVKKSYVFNFVSYKKKKLYLIKSTIDNKYHVFCEINNKMVTLDRIFIQIEGGSFWVPHVRYIDISGKDIAKNNEEVAERVIP